jgi:betaine-aldehyde dehydrogenase
MESLVCGMGWIASPTSPEGIRDVVDACVAFASQGTCCCWDEGDVAHVDKETLEPLRDEELHVLAAEIPHVLNEERTNFNASIAQTRRLVALYRRYSRLLCLVAAMEEGHEAFAAVDAQETGVPVSITKQITMGYGPAARAFLTSGLRFLEDRFQERIPGRYGAPIVRVCMPLSPALIIAPWNVPFGTILPKLFLAWLCGCSVIIKPSEYAHKGICAMISKLTSVTWASTLSQGDGFASSLLLPRRAVQVLCGGPEMGATLTEHPGIRCVQFTGASSTAFRVAAVCARFLRPFHAECGGSNAAVVTLGSDLDLAVRCIATGMTTLNGQWCMGLTRILIHDSMVNAFLHKFVGYMNAHVRVVDPEVDTSETSSSSASPDDILVGRLAHAEHARRLCNLCDTGGSSNVLLLGEMPAAFANSSSSSCYFQPRLLMDPDPKIISAEELFGPAAGLIRFQTVDEAIDIVNLSSGQLACYIFGSDTDALYRLAPRIHTGMVMINSVNFCFEVADGHSEPLVDFVGTAGHGADGNGAALASFFTTSMWVGVNGPAG